MNNRLKALGTAVIMLVFLCGAGQVLAEELPGTEGTEPSAQETVMNEGSEGSGGGTVTELTEGSGDSTQNDQTVTEGASGNDGNAETPAPGGNNDTNVENPSSGSGEGSGANVETPVSGEGSGANAGTPVSGEGSGANAGTPVSGEGSGANIETPVSGEGGANAEAPVSGGNGTANLETPASGEGGDTNVETPASGEDGDTNLETPAAAENNNEEISAPAEDGSANEESSETPEGEAGGAQDMTPASGAASSPATASEKTTEVSAAAKTTANTSAAAKTTASASAAAKTSAGTSSAAKKSAAAPKTVSVSAKTGSSSKVAPRLLPDGWYVIHTAIDRKRVLDISAGSTANGANIQLYTGNNSDAQIFRLQYDSKTGTYRITNRKSSKAISIASTSKANGVNVVQLAVSASAQQQWELQKMGNNVYRLVNKQTGKVLDVAGGRNNDRTNVQTYAGNNTAAQGWVFTRLNASQMQAFNPLPGEWFTISSSKSMGKVVDIDAGSVKAGANVQLYETNGSDAQKFKFVYDYNTDSYKIINKKSGKALSVAGNTKGNGNVNQNTSNDQLGQLWQVKQHSNGTFTLISRLSGRALDLAGGRTSDRTNVQVYSSNNTPAQRWVIHPAVNTTCSQVIGNGVYYIATALNATQVLDVDGASKNDGANVQLFDINNSKAQMFRLTYDTKTKSYKIENLNSSQALNVSKGNRASGANVNQGIEYSDRSAQQHWAIQKTKDGYYTIVSALSGKVLDVQGAKAKNGTNVQAYCSNDTNAQKWMILTADTSPALGNGVYEISSALDTSLLVSVKGESMSEQANVQLQTDASKDAQRFAITRESDGTYRVNNYNSGKLLSTAGSNVQQEINGERKDQKWRLKDAGGGLYYLQNVQTGKYLESASDGAASGTNVQLNSGNGTTAQKFYIKKQSVTPVASGTYTIALSSNSSQVMDVENGSRKVNAEIQTWSSNNSNAQKYQIKLESDGYYTITNVKSKHALGVYGRSLNSGMTIHQEVKDGSLYQKWLLHKNDNGTITFINANSGKTIASNGKGNEMTQAGLSGDANRQFRLKATSGQDNTAVDKSIEDGTVNDTMLSYANTYTSKTNNIIVVDRGHFRTNVYSGSKGFWKQIQSYLCSVGREGYETTPGLTEIKIGGRSLYFDSGPDVRCWYPSRLTNGRIIHSVLYSPHSYPQPGPVLQGNLGVRISNGCVRLPIEQAKWIFDNVPEGTAVYIY